MNDYRWLDRYSDGLVSGRLGLDSRRGQVYSVINTYPASYPMSALGKGARA
jgi:hypothetical protein